MKAILLTAGFGSRLRPLTNILPKCLLPINGHPLLEYWFSLLREGGVGDILMNLHYLPDVMREWVEGTEYAGTVAMAYEEELLGTGGTLLRNSCFVGTEPVMLVHADNLCDVNIRDFIKAHIDRPGDAEITMMTFVTPAPGTCGIVELDQMGMVKSFHEKVENPPGNLAHAAVYIIEPTVMRYLSSLNKPFIDFSIEVLPAYVEMGKVFTYHNGTYHRDIGNVESYMKAQIEFSQPSSANEKKGSWPSMCRRDGGSIGRRLVEALSIALDAEVIDWACGSDTRLDEPAMEGNRTIVWCSDFDTALGPIKRFAEDVRWKPSQASVFFTKVTEGFSSREFYKNTGLMSVALYSTDEQKKDGLVSRDSL
jgi:mannose-1-phosphate guanylyltransferase